MLGLSRGIDGRLGRYQLFRYDDAYGIASRHAQTKGVAARQFRMPQAAHKQAVGGERAGIPQRTGVFDAPPNHQFGLIGKLNA